MKQNWNENWYFTKDLTDDNSWTEINLPHTWNGTDGQDGGNDYYRGTCFYKKSLDKADLPEGLETYIEFEGVNSSADLFVNGVKVIHHDGGYSTWRANLTEYIADHNEIIVHVDNAPNDKVYPQVADFTFYGGIYRNVNLISVPHAHFDLDYWGSPAVQIIPQIEGNNALVSIDAYLTGITGREQLLFEIIDGESVIASTTITTDTRGVELEIKNVHLWHGTIDPYLYAAKITLFDKGEILDRREVRFGCRTFEIDPEKGFILNGKSYPLRGVSRHQDRPGIGNALLPEHHVEDMDLICEMGANTIRLAHYQHDRYFYDLCDEKGIVVWAEIPYISQHMPNGRDNAQNQLKELIIQNFNHPSIVVWGISNEITLSGITPDLIETHKLLNDTAHRLDSRRLTTMAVVTMCNMDNEYVHFTDVVSYNHYFGWYGGETSMNGEFMDRFHAKYPDKPIGMSEYGCEALNWHTSNPTQGDYTEEYQAYYHEELIKQLFTRPYIWATHVWNMFDFAADARAEGGEDGMNHKGLITFDRKYKKDSFYAYKAWLSDEPFVHVCGKRYIDRVEDVTKVTVYSNLPTVSLFVNGELLDTKTCEDHFFYFEVPLKGDTNITAKATNEAQTVSCEDSSVIRKVDTFNEEYRMKEAGDIINWFEITAPDGFLSVNDKLSDIYATARGTFIINSLMFKMLFKAKRSSQKKSEKKGGGMGIKINSPEIKKLVGGMTMKRIFSMIGTAGLNVTFTKEEILDINRRLNKIKKKKI